MKRIAVVLALTAALVATLLPETSQADPGLSAGLGIFNCQILITFPATNAVPKSKCGGWARGAMVATGDKPGVVVFDGNGNFQPKTPLIGAECQNPNTCVDNFQVDVTTYSEPCVVNGEPPLVGQATGTSHIWGHYLPDLTREVQVNFAFDYIRVGPLFVATLSRVKAKNVTTKSKKDADGNGVGVAYGIFLPKITETLGSCGASQQNHIDIVGNAVFVAQ